MNASFAASGEHTSSFYRTDSRSPDVSPRAAKPTLPHISTNSTKPPIPTSPKPTFNKRSKSAQPPAHRSAAPGDSPVAQEATVPSTLPPTTNFLKPQERSDRVRQTRKLAQMFGQSPGAIEAVAFSQLSFEANPPGGFLSASNNLVSNLTGKKKHQKAAVSMSVVPELENPAQPHSPEGIKNSLWSSRRHSSPLSPQQFSFIDASSSHDSHSSGVDQSSFVIEIGSQQGTAFSDWGSQIDREFRSGPTSPTSFMDLSEEDIANDTASSIITIQTPKADRRPGLLSSASSVYSFTSEDLAEEDRRRKREKLAKLHRFLGSRVPADLVLGQLDVTVATDLPPVAPVSAIERSDKMDPETRKVWVRRRRSSSAAELRGKWSDDIDRLKEELNDKEKAQNVRRAVKMEKLFGVQPPQTLYHTRFAPSHAEAAIGTPSHLRQQTLPPSPSSPSYSRNVNQAAYTRNKVKKANHRPGTAESTEPLINANTSHGKLPAIGHGFSDIYEHYRHSLNSLNDIIDRDDRASLERLHGIIHGESSEPILQPFTRQEEPPYEEPPTPKAERRRSLPTRTSMASISSAYSVAAPSEEEINFRARRKRAAKLTQFFGVDYRDLMGEVIDSLEKGLEEEGGRGTLRPDEVQELLHKLRKLKSKRNSLFN
ncbi:hypothetical protein EW026_g495 [Hermanssonia centrifuga]|uniref:Uncharacterized protein n=1 Tax=Hermanssonia centrifuga TaxID=98765 RepID=A0A4V3XBK9_9APHY|nr:hypothetical protein EW026_g495 [Hermanssonia centrifuga]